MIRVFLCIHISSLVFRRNRREHHHREHKHEAEAVPERERRAQAHSANDGGRDGFTEAVEDGFIGADEAHAGHVEREGHDIADQDDAGDADTSTGERAQFQAVDSTLHSKIKSGAMFYVTNTSAYILLSGTTLDFDSTKAKLLQIEGNDANNWGRAGSNGANVTFTGLGETLTGDISVDRGRCRNRHLAEHCAVGRHRSHHHRCLRRHHHVPPEA